VPVENDDENNETGVRMMIVEWRKYVKVEHDILILLNLESEK
jgi:hypothetical protein